MREYPRVLVINGEPFWSGSATGLTMTSLFRGWPNDRLACLYISKKKPDMTICNRYWSLTGKDLRIIRRLIGAFLSSNPAAVPKPAIELALETDRRSKNANTALLSMAKGLRQRLAGQSIRDLDTYLVPNQILKEIDEFRPQVIYSMLATNPLLKLVIELSERFSIPVVPHFMDDWLSTCYCHSMFRVPLRKTMLKRMQVVLSRSPQRFVIGDAMAEEYTHRYGGDFVPFMKTVETELLEQPFTPPPMRSKVRFVYLGGLHLNRWRSLHEIGMTLKTLHSEGLEVEALVFSQPRFAKEGKKLDMPPVMRFVGSLSPAEVPAVLQNADVLLHVESFDIASKTFARYSVSTKIPESMAAGRPILAYGPVELASIRYVQDSGAGLIVGKQDRDNDLLLDSLRKLTTSRSLREDLGKKGLRAAGLRHNAALLRSQFSNIINEVAVGGGQSLFEKYSWR